MTAFDTHLRHKPDQMRWRRRAEVYAGSEQQPKDGDRPLAPKEGSPSPLIMATPRFVNARHGRCRNLNVSDAGPLVEFCGKGRAIDVATDSRPKFHDVTNVKFVGGH
jgi:hypothetical protein